MKLKSLRSKLMARRSALGQVSLLWANTHVGQLISFVYLVAVIRQLNLVGFSEYVVGFAFSAIGAIFVDFGTNGIFSSQVAASQRDKTRAKSDLRTIRCVTTSLLAILGCILYSAGGLTLIMYTGLMVGALSVFNESWLLQAEGRVKHFIFADTIARASTLVTWILISTQVATAFTALLSLGVGYLIRSIYTNTMTRVHGSVFTIPDRLSNLFSIAAPIVAGKFLYSLTNQLTPIVFAFNTSKGALGVYSSAEKPVRALQAGANSYEVFANPRIARKLNDPDLIRHVKKHLITLAGLTSVLAIFVIVFAPVLSVLLLGVVDDQFVVCSRILAVLPVFSSLTNLIGVAVTPLLGETKINILSASFGVLTLGLGILLTPKPLTSMSMAVIILLVEVSIAAVSVTWTLSHLKRRELEK